VKTLGELEEKVWYRFLKLIFVFSYLLSVGFFLILAYGTPPSREFFILCDNGKVSAISPDEEINDFDDIQARLICGGRMENIVDELSITIELRDEILKIILRPGQSLNKALKEAAKRDKKLAGFISDKKLVQKKETGEFALWDGKNLVPVKASARKVRKLTPDEKIDPLPENNYKVQIRESYKEAVRTFLYSLLAIVIVGEIIRRSFFYVAVGKPFFSWSSRSLN
jgi:hypothetical protein